MTADKAILLAEARERFPPIWIVYDRPLDFPDYYVVRVWYGLCPSPDCALLDSLQEARDYIEEEGGSVRLERAKHDDPTVVETWL